MRPHIRGSPHLKVCLCLPRWNMGNYRHSLAFAARGDLTKESEMKGCTGLIGSVALSAMVALAAPHWRKDVEAGPE